ncbi:zinc finger, CCHC-type containing protein [Tanacetum coccineum]
MQKANSTSGKWQRPMKYSYGLHNIAFAYPRPNLFMACTKRLKWSIMKSWTQPVPPKPRWQIESSVINKYVLDGESNDEEAANQVSEGDEEDLGVINGNEPESSQDVSSKEDESQKDQISGNGTSYYKLEIVKIHLILAHGNQCPVLNNTNYTLWALRIKKILVANGVWDLVEGTSTSKEIDVKKDSSASAYLFQGLPEDLQMQVAGICENSEKKFGTL